MVKKKILVVDDDFPVANLIKITWKTPVIRWISPWTENQSLKK